MEPQEDVIVDIPKDRLKFFDGTGKMLLPGCGVALVGWRSTGLRPGGYSAEAKACMAGLCAPRLA